MRGGPSVYGSARIKCSPWVNCVDTQRRSKWVSGVLTTGCKLRSLLVLHTSLEARNPATTNRGMHIHDLSPLVIRLALTTRGAGAFSEKGNILVS